MYNSESLFRCCLILLNIVYKCVQGGFVGLAKASGLRTAEAGRAAKKAEVNLKAPFALIIEVGMTLCGDDDDDDGSYCIAFKRAGSTDA